MKKQKNMQLIKMESLTINIILFQKNERIVYTITGCILFFIIGFTFYKSVVLSGILALVGFLFPDFMYENLLKKRQKKLNYQFKDLLYSISSSLSAGKSLESAFKESIDDLALLYPDPETDIIREVKYIIRGLEVNETIESLLSDFADRSNDEDIKNFADVLVSCKRTGGNLIQVVRITSDIISDKIEIKREIALSLSEKKTEQSAMSGLMIVIIIALTYMAGDYMDSMFSTLSGRMAMTFTMGLFFVSYIVGKKITDIEV